jgi:hypothetical protein
MSEIHKKGDKMSSVVNKLNELIDLIKEKEENEEDVLEEEFEEEESAEIPEESDEIRVSWEEIKDIYHAQIKYQDDTARFAKFILDHERQKKEFLEMIESTEKVVKQSIRELEKLYNIDESDNKVLVIDSDEEGGYFRKA